MQSISSADILEFAQVGDVHYSLNDTYKEKYLHFLSLSLRKKYPDFVMFLGDNVDKSNEENVIGFMRSIHSIRQPYYLLFGDKDAYSLGGVEKETYLDLQIDDLSTELEAINTEIQSVQSLIDDAVSSVFDWGSG